MVESEKVFQQQSVISIIVSLSLSLSLLHSCFSLFLLSSLDYLNMISSPRATH
ncbi:MULTISPECIES: hypothetical protein [unclassified Candidatus Cardinium]|uniref:hypothetical protein n=1 Tax=unclassified Candidatus Cardinium TaxID=2641185 RepID=UPI001FB1BC74|nr:MULTISPECIES: hypothetical protein [unclassified Candidatus Cardinium]